MRLLNQKKYSRTLSAENQREFKRPLYLWLAEGFNRNRPWSETVAQLLLADVFAGHRERPTINSDGSTIASDGPDQ